MHAASFRRLSIATLVIAAAGSGRAEATENRFLVAPVGPTMLGDASDATVVRRRPVLVDVSAMDQLTPGTRELLPLFANVSRVCVIDSRGRDNSGREIVRGHIEGMPGSQVRFAKVGGDVSAIVHAAGTSYRIRTTPNGLADVSELDPTKFGACATTPAADGGADLGNGLPPVPVGDPPPAGDPCDDGSTIDVLILYTGAARAAAGGVSAIEAEAALAIDASNTAYANSGITTRLRLVYVAETSYNESGTYTDHLTRLTNNGDAFMDEAHTLRDSYGADLVSLLVADPAYCGLAWVMTSNSPTFASYGFSVTTWTCAAGNLSFPHELGHNMGSCHDHDNCSGGVSSYSWGHRFTGDSSTQWRTVMAYSPGFRIDHFSNPDIDYDGQPTGVASGALVANNALSINDTTPTVANFRCAIVSVPTITSLTGNPDPVDQGVTLTLTANGVADSDGVVTEVRFYEDTDDTGDLTGGDTLLGTDSDATGGWTQDVATGGYVLGTVRFFAVATDDTSLDSAPVQRDVTVGPPVDPGEYVGPADGSWFSNVNWAGGSMPTSSVDVTMDTSVLLAVGVAQAQDVTIEAGGVLFVVSGGTLLARDLTIEDGAALMIMTGGVTSFDNVVVETGGLLMIADGDLYMSTVAVRTGATLGLLDPAARIFGGTVTVDDGGVLSGEGLITGNVVNSGEVDPGLPIGSLSLDGSYTQTGTGLLTIDVSGYTPGNEIDELSMSGTATLAGSVSFIEDGSFVPAEGTGRFVDGTISGMFDTMSVPSPEGGFTHLVSTVGGGVSFKTIEIASCGVTTYDQWASGVVGFSSQWSATSYAAAQTLGAPDVPSYGDSTSAWAASTRDGTLESVTVSFDQAVYASGVTVRETNGNGFVYQVDVIDEDGLATTVWSGTDSSSSGAPADFLVSFAQTAFLVEAVKVYVDTDATATWEEIDAIMLHGVRGPVEEWADELLAFSSQWSSSSYAASQALGTPNVSAYGDSTQAWTPANKNGTLESITVGFPTLLYADGVLVRETLGSGYVYQVDVLDEGGTPVTVWSGTDPSPPGAVADLQIQWTETTYLVSGVRIHIDTDASAGWEELDAIKIHGRVATANDCNSNGIIDECDIAAGTSLDNDANLLPDECTFAPTVDALVATPAGVPQGGVVTLTATNPDDADGTVASVRFYRDADASGSLTGGDTLLNTDSSPAGGWAWSGSTGSWAQGSHMVFALATDDDGLDSNVVSGSVFIDPPPDPGQYVGAPGGSWFVGANWGSGTVPNAGTTVRLGVNVVIGSPGAVANAVALEDGAMLVVESGGTLATGSLVVEDGATLIIDDGTVSGTSVNVESGGTLTMIDVTSALSATNVNIYIGGTLSGLGTITADVDNAGEIDPGQPIGTLAIDGTYTQQSTGVLTIDAAGYDAGTTLDELTVTGNANVGGVLNVVANGGFTPTEDAGIVVAASVVGEFDSTTLPADGGGFSHLAGYPAGGVSFATAEVDTCAVATYDQWASSVLAYSSQWSSSSYAAWQTLGEPDVLSYGDSSSAWAASTRDGTLESITVGFDMPVYASGVTVRETNGNGFVYRIDVIDEFGAATTAWSGTDSSTGGAPADFLVQFPQTAFLVYAVKVYVDTDATATWEEVDAIALHGALGPVDQMASGVIGFTSQWSATSYSAAQTLGASNVASYGDSSSAWAASTKNGTLEFVTVGFPMLVYADGVTVRETNGNGFVFQVDVIDEFGNAVTVWSGADPSTPGTAADFLIQWTETAFLVSGVTIHVDTDTSDTWEEIDSITLHGSVGAADDCNGNGVLDACDIVSGTSLDANTNSIPDECEAPDPIAAGDVSVEDVLAGWGTCPLLPAPCPADLDRNGVVDGDDLLLAMAP